MYKKGSSSSSSAAAAPTPTPLLESLHQQTIAEYSKDAVRAIYSTNGQIYAVVGTSICRKFDKSNPEVQDAFQLDMRVSTADAFVFQDKNRALIVSNAVTVIVDLEAESQYLCPYKLPEAGVVPLDFDGASVLLLCKTEEITFLKILLLDVSRRSMDVAATTDLETEAKFFLCLPKPTCLCLARFFPPGRLLVCKHFSAVEIYSFISSRGGKKTTSTAPPSSSSSSAPILCDKYECEPLSIEILNEQHFAVLYRNGVIRIYNASGACLVDIHLHKAGAKFERHGYPYLMKGCAGWLLVSSDYELWNIPYVFSSLN